MNLDNKLLSKIEDYCKINNLDTEKFVNELLSKAFMVEKYGDKPPFLKKKEEKVFTKDEVFINNEQEENTEHDKTNTEKNCIIEEKVSEEINLKIKKPAKRVTKRKLS